MGWGGGGGGGGGAGGESALKAIDVTTGQIKWTTPRYGGGNSGLLATAGNLVFGGNSGGLQAYNATTGEPLWVGKIGNISNGPMTFVLDGGSTWLRHPAAAWSRSCSTSSRPFGRGMDQS